MSMMLLKITGDITQLQSCAERGSGTSRAPGARARVGGCMDSLSADGSPTSTPGPGLSPFLVPTVRSSAA